MQRKSHASGRMGLRLGEIARNEGFGRIFGQECCQMFMQDVLKAYKLGKYKIG